LLELLDITWRDLGLVALSAGVGSVGYLLTRRIERKPDKDRLELRSMILDLHTRLKAQGMTVTELDELGTALTERRKATRKIEDEVDAELAVRLAYEPRPEDTQAGMNQIAAADLKISRAMLAKLLTELEMYSEGESLKHAQKSWEAYAEAEARHRSSLYEGGTVYPLMYASELQSLIVSRIAELRAHLEWLKSLRAV
jgi:uncharacterized protein YecT (DUF1311 family)